MIEETIEKYIYDSEKEKYEHGREMQNDGFEDNGVVRKNLGTVMNPEYVDFGCYSKSIRVVLTR